MLWLVLTVALMALSLLALIGTLLFRKRMSTETARVLFGLIPLELCVLIFGSPALWVLLFVLFRFP